MIRITGYRIRATHSVPLLLQLNPRRRNRLLNPRRRNPQLLRTIMLPSEMQQTVTGTLMILAILFNVLRTVGIRPTLPLQTMHTISQLAAAKSMDQVAPDR